MDEHERQSLTRPPLSLEERMVELEDIEQRYLQLVHALGASTGQESGFRSLLQAVFGALDMGVCLLDAGLQYVWVNPRLAEMNNLPAQDHVGRSVKEVLPDLYPLVLEPARRVLATNRPVWQWPMTVSSNRRASSDRTFYEAGYLPLKHPFREETMVLVLVQRVELEHSVHHQLKQARLDYEVLLENANDAIFILDPSTEVVLQANRRACQMYGFDQSQLVGLSFKDLTRDVAKGEQKIRELMVAGSLSNFETCHIRKDGTPLDVRVNASVIQHGSRRAILVIAHDISDLRQIQRELSESVLRLRTVMEGTVEAMAMTVERRDPYTAGHQRRVASLSVAIARMMGLPQETVDGIRWAGMVHDLGKVAIPAELLSKPGSLTELEFALIKTHSEQGREILDTIQFPWPVANLVMQHHERMDGSGYPGGLVGDAIAIGARILAVADVVEAMAYHRPYRPALGIPAAMQEIRAFRSKLYDPDVVDCALTLFEKKGFVLE